MTPTASRPRPGRPPLADVAGKTRTFRLTDEVMAQLGELAATWECNRTDALRRAIANCLEVVSKERA